MAKIIMLGDSTVSSFEDVSYYYPRYGYGVLLSEYVKGIEVLNSNSKVVRMDGTRIIALESGRATITLKIKQSSL